jgi:hypothetical protein
VELNVQLRGFDEAGVEMPGPAATAQQQQAVGELWVN